MFGGEDADKPEIKQAVEKMFNVEVERVQVINVKGKRKRLPAHAGQAPRRLEEGLRAPAEGHDIDFIGGE